MVGLLVASHGEFCVGLKGSTEMIGGEIAQCEALPLRPGTDPEDYGKQLAQKIDELDTGDGVLVLIDLRGGTPFNQSLMLSRDKNIQLVIGANLPMLLVLALGRNDETTLDDLAAMALDAGKESMDIVKFDK